MFNLLVLFFGHGTHQNLSKHFPEVTKEFDLLKLYQISMDGPSVNLKFYNVIVQDRQENMVRSLIDIVSCSLHIVHDSFKTGAEKTGWYLKALVHSKFFMAHLLEEKIMKQSLVPISIHYSSALHSESFFAFVCFFSVANLDILT